jgi:hypothetical protein
MMERLDAVDGTEVSLLGPVSWVQFVFILLLCLVRGWFLWLPLFAIIA